jgi:hypothetical protein
MSIEPLAELKRAIQDHERRISELETTLGQKKKQQPPKTTSVKEFILEKRPLNDLNKTLTIAYYAEKHRQTSPFTIKDLQQLFRDAREPLPTNLSDAVNKNIAKGYIMEAEDKKDGHKSWTLTSTGERFVENGLKEAA